MTCSFSYTFQTYIYLECVCPWLSKYSLIARLICYHNCFFLFSWSLTTRKKRFLSKVPGITSCFDMRWKVAHNLAAGHPWVSGCKEYQTVLQPWALHLARTSPKFASTRLKKILSIIYCYSEYICCLNWLPLRQHHFLIPVEEVKNSRIH